MEPTTQAPDGFGIEVIKREVTRTDTFVKLDGQEFDAWEVKRNLEQLAETDTYFNRIVMQNGDLEKVFAAKSVVWTSIRGSVAKGVNYKQFVKEFEAVTGETVEQD